VNLNLTLPLHGIDKLDQILKINVLNLWKKEDLNFGVNDDILESML
jgi:hypothetical protein